MRYMISRPARAMLPLAMALCAVFFPGGAERAVMLMAALFMARGLSLCAGGAIRAAAGAVVRASRLRGNLLTAIVMAAFGGAATILLSISDIPYIRDVGIWTAVSGAAINLSQVFADRMYASEDRRSAAIYDVIIAMLAAVGLIISGADGWLMPVLTGSGMLAGGLLLAGLKNGSSMQKGFRVLRHAPAAMLRGWLFPAALTAGAVYFGGIETDIAAALAGVAVLEFCEPAYRRSEAESSACGLWLAVLSAAWVAMSVAGMYSDAAIPEFNSRAPIFTAFFACTVPFACFGAAITGLALNARRVFMALLMPAGILLSVPDIKDVRRAARARRIHKRRR